MAPITQSVKEVVVNGLQLLTGYGLEWKRRREILAGDAAGRPRHLALEGG